MAKRQRLDDGVLDDSIDVITLCQDLETVAWGGMSVPKTFQNISGYNVHSALGCSIDWFFAVGFEYRLLRITVHQAVLNFVRFLVGSVRDGNLSWANSLEEVYPKWKVFLSTALFVAAKTCEVIQSDLFCTIEGIASLWPESTKETQNQIKSAEIQMLQTLEWRFCGSEIFVAPNIIGFLLNVDRDKNEYRYKKTMQLIEFAMLDADFVKFMPSIIAVGALCVLEGDQWFTKNCFSYTQDDLKECMTWLFEKRIWLECHCAAIPRKDIEYDIQQHWKDCFKLWKSLTEEQSK